MSRNLDSLIYALRGGDPGMRRSDAAKALGELGDIRAVQPLINALQRDENIVVRGYAARALGKLGDKRAVEPLIAALQDESSSVPIFAAEALGCIGDARAIEPLIPLLESYYIDTRSTAADALGKIGEGDIRATEPLINALLKTSYGQENEVRWAVMATLVKIGRQAVESLVATLSNSDAEIRVMIVKALGEIGDSQAVMPLIDRLNDVNVKVCQEAAQALAKIGGQQTVDLLIGRLRDSAPEARIGEARVLGEIGDERAIAELEHLIKERKLPEQISDINASTVIIDAINKIKQRRDNYSNNRQGLDSSFQTTKNNMNYPSNFLDIIKSTAHTNYLATQLANEIDNWLIVDNYLHAEKVVGTLAIGQELIISDDFKKETKWDEEIIVWTFRDLEGLNEFKDRLNEVLYSFMTQKLSDNYSPPKFRTLSADLFRYEKQTDIMVGRYRWKGYALNPPIERFGTNWYWAKTDSDRLISAEKHSIEAAIGKMMKWYFRNVVCIDPKEFPTRRWQALREAGGEYVRTMGRISFMRKVRTLGSLLQKQPIEI